MECCAIIWTTFGRVCPKAEVLDDVESRLAEILRERMPVSGQVVDLKLVRGAMATIGEADCFGERRAGAEYDRELFGEYADGPAPRKLYRARVDRVLAGVCSGIARYFGWDPTLVRVAMVVLAIVTVSAAFWAYIILWILVPEQPLDRRVFNDTKKGRR
jgi:phage shock protein PspC (stress-responsive transcriptional regulator)